MDAGEGIFQGLMAIAQGLQRRFELQHQQELQRQQQDIISNQITPQFQTQTPEYTPSEYGKPATDQYGVPRLAQPVTPVGISGWKSTPTTPSPSSPEFLSALSRLISVGGAPYANLYMGAAQSGQPTYPTLSPGEAIVKKTGDKVTQLYQNPFKPPTGNSTDWQTEYDASGKPAYEKIPGTNATRVREFKWQENPMTGKMEKITRLSAAGTEPTGMLANAPLDKNSIEMVAQNYLMQGESALSAMGRNYVGRAQVIKRAAELAYQNGMDAQARQITKNLTKSVGSSISNLTKQRDAVLAFEKTAEKNLQIALDKSKAVDRTGSPIFNKWLLWAQGKGQGSPEVASFDAAVHVAANEVAKVTSTTTGNLVPQQEREEYRNILNTALTSKGFEEVVNVLKQDMANRKTSYEEQLSEMRQNFPNLTPQTSSGTVRFNLNGTQYNIPSNEVDDFLKENPGAQRQ